MDISIAAELSDCLQNRICSTKQLTSRLKNFQRRPSTLPTMGLLLRHMSLVTSTRILIKAMQVR